MTEIKSIPIPTLVSSQFRCPDTKTKLISIHPLQTSHVRPPHINQVNSDPYTEIKSISTTVYKNQVNFDHPHKTKSIDTHTKNKSFSARKQNQVILDPYKKSQVISARTQKRSQFWPPHHKVDFDPHTKTKSISIPRAQT